MLIHCVRHEEAIEALQHAVRLVPSHMEARTLLADTLHVSGRIEEAIAAHHGILAEASWIGTASWGLANIKKERPDANHAKQMRRAPQHSNARDDDRIATGFALAKALEDEGRSSSALV